MYQKYSTEALVLGSRESGESDRFYSLFTKDFGLVRARATAVRHERSRMRYALQNYSRANVSLVKGKRGWRVAGATSLSTAMQKDSKGLSAFARIAELTNRLVAGEEESPYIFAALSEAHAALMRGANGTTATIEIVCVARMLFALGYISDEALQTAIFTHTDYAIEHLDEAEKMKDRLLASINRAISETHL
jgi:DNA repair protein RecO